METQTANGKDVATQGPKPLRVELESLSGQFKAALPPHIPVERFVRIVVTAVHSNPDLANADRKSLFEAAMKAAQDGLLPDNREAAFVIFGGKVQYMPMVWGIVKKVRNSGDLATISAHIVYENDKFSYNLGDDERIEHNPLLVGERGAAMLVYAIAKTKDGSVYREVLTKKDVMDIRSVSKSRSGPWTGPFELEMWKKSAIRRLSKRLPMSTDLEEVIRRDDDMYDLTARNEPDPIALPARISERADAEYDQRPAEEVMDPTELRKKIVDWIDEASQAELQKPAAVDQLFTMIQPLPDKDVQELTFMFNQKKAGKAK